MSTIAERLRQFAAIYRRKADALELAAAEVDGAARTSARASFDGKLREAVALRQQATRAAARKTKKKKPAERAAAEAAPEGEGKLATQFRAREALLRQALVDGPQSTKQLVAYTASQGLPLSTFAVRDVLQKMKGVKHTGATLTARWSLRG